MRKNLTYTNDGIGTSFAPQRGLAMDHSMTARLCWVAPTMQINAEASFSPGPSKRREFRLPERLAPSNASLTTAVRLP